MKEKTGIKTAFSLTRFMSLVFFYTSLHCTENKNLLKISLKISSVNVTKSAIFCGFGHIYRRNA